MKYLIAVFLILLFILLIKSKISFMNPVWIFVVLWGAMLTCSVILWKPEYEWNYNGVIWILLACFACLFGGICAQKIKSGVTEDNKFEGVLSRNNRWQFLLIIILLGLIKIPVDLMLHGYSVADIFKVGNWGTISSDITYERYFGENGTATSLFGQIVLLFIYLAPLYSGFCFNYRRKKRHSVLCAIAFLPIVMEVVFTTGKAGFIASVILFIIGLFSGYICKYGKSIKLTKKKILFIIITAFLVLGFLFWAMLWRVGGNVKYIPLIADKAKEYAFGCVPAFDNWLGNYYTFNPSMGRETFLAVSSLLGLATKQAGVYDFLNGYSQSNVFTCFRALIQDYGAVGGLFIVFLLGFCGSLAYKKIINRSKHFLLWLVAYQLIIFYSTYGMIISPWTYTSFILIFPMFFVCVRLTYRQGNTHERVRAIRQYVKN